MVRTQNGENGRVADPLAGHILRHAGIIAHVGQTGLNDQQMSLAADDQVAAFLFRLDGHAILLPGDIRRWDPLRCQAAQFHLALQFNTPRVRILRKVFADN